jgi:feruloyl esterase
MSAQRYPEDYDGIIAGAPAWDFTRLSQIFIWNGVSMTRTPGSNIPPAKLPALEAAVLAQCDALDGQRDGLVRDPRACRFDPTPLRCAGADSDACLTGDQVAAVADILRGPPIARATRIGYSPAGAEAHPGGWAPWISSTDPMKTGAGVFGLGLPRFFANMPDASFANFDFGRDGPLLDKALGPILNADSPDLSAFFKRGGKLILYHGWGDAAIPPQMSIEYYEMVRARMGAAAAQNMRLFMVPGMQHCNAGPGLNSFGQGAPPYPGARPEEDIGAALEAWVTRGRAPEQLVAASSSNLLTGPMDRRLAKATRTGLLCAFPRVAVWDGEGNADAAASYRCEAPR